MKLNRLEELLMDNALRAWFQGSFEAPRIFQGVELPPGARCLEIGCGRGVGARLILQRFQPERVLATDLDPGMIARARAYLAQDGRADGRISLMVADASHLPFTDGSFEACFDFGALHHIPTWRRAVAEVARVLKPGGVFAGEELFLHPPFTRFFPGTTIPGARELLQAFETAGLGLTRHRGLGPGFSIFQARKALL